MSDLIKVEVTDGIQIITINRPEAKNAINLEAAQAMAAALDQLDSRDDVRIGILTGGGGTFSSGMDLKAFAKSGQRPYVEGRGFAGLNERPPKKPLIAAVEGYALAGGCEMALASDLIVAASNAKFGLPEVKRGLVAGAGGMRLPRRLPYHIAMEVILTGEMLTAERAHSFGLVNRLTEPGGALAGALELARGIVENGPLAVQTAKSIVSQSGDWDQEGMFDRQRPLIAHIFRPPTPRKARRPSLKSASLSGRASKRRSPPRGPLPPASRCRLGAARRRHGHFSLAAGPAGRVFRFSIQTVNRHVSHH